MNIKQYKTKYQTPIVNISVTYLFYRVFSIIFGFIKYIIFSPKFFFVVDGERYYYFYHRYNMTWENERCVEIPLIQKEMVNIKDADILEVGNVLSHYFSIEHDVV